MIWCLNGAPTGMKLSVKIGWTRRSYDTGNTSAANEPNSAKDRSSEPIAVSSKGRVI